jgi:hypothetical protein
MLQQKLFQKYVMATFAVFTAAALTGCEAGLSVTDATARSVRAESRRGSAEGAERADEDQHRNGGDRDQRGSDARGDSRAAGRDGDRDARTAERDGEHRSGDGEEQGVERNPGDDAPHTYALTPAQARAIDLEFSPGLPEPPQDEVRPAPRPWTPEPSAESASAKPVIEDVWPDKAPASGGEKVVIRGKNLQAAQVVFGLTPAHILGAAEDAVMVAAPPAGAGQVAIVVTNRDGSYAIAGGAFSYYR